eukprot:954039_1
MATAILKSEKQAEKDHLENEAKRTKDEAEAAKEATVKNLVALAKGKFDEAKVIEMLNENDEDTVKTMILSSLPSTPNQETPKTPNGNGPIESPTSKTEPNMGSGGQETPKTPNENDPIGLPKSNTDPNVGSGGQGSDHVDPASQRKTPHMQNQREGTTISDKSNVQPIIPGKQIVSQQSSKMADKTEVPVVNADVKANET